MTTYDYRTGTDGRTGTDTNDSKDQARQAVATAQADGKHLAEEARGEAKAVASDAQAQARDLLDQARSELESQSRSQLEMLVSTLQGFADDLERMARGEGASSGLAQDVVREVSDKATALSAQLRDREPGELLDQARGYARSKPGTFLLGALAAGVVAGRFARGAKDAHGSTGGHDSTGGTTAGTTPAAPDATSTAALPLSQGTPAPPPPSPMPGNVTGSAPQEGTTQSGTPQPGTGTGANGWGNP